MTDGPVPAPDHGDNFHEPIEHWGSAPGPRAALIVGTNEQEPVTIGPTAAQQAMLHSQQNAALQSLITATGSHVTLGTPDLGESGATQGPGPEEKRLTQDQIDGLTQILFKRWPLQKPDLDGIPVTDEMLAAVPCRFWRSNAPTPRDIAEIYRAMAAVAPVELYGPNERRIDALESDLQRTVAVAERRLDRITALEADNAALVAKLAAPEHPGWETQYRATKAHLKVEIGRRLALEAENAILTDLARQLGTNVPAATFGPVTPADLPDPPRRADGTLAPVAKPLPVIKAHDPSRRVGG